MSRLTHSVEDVGGWFVAEGEIGDLPMLLRGRTRLGELRRHPFLSKRLTVVWTLARPGRVGFPERDDYPALEAYEHAVVAALERDGLGLLTTVLTHAGARVWTYYVNDTVEVRRRMEGVTADEPALPIQLTSEDDPAWEAYARMIQETGVSAE